MILKGRTTLEFITLLQKLFEEHGDQYVFMVGNDYPECVTGVYKQNEDDPYIPKASFVIY